ncbi:MAG: CPBP family intramembrane glutamic endopeptidase [Pseudomonadota bacterium]
MTNEHSIPSRPWWLISIVTIAAFFAIDQINSPIYQALAEGTDGWTRRAIFVAVIYGSIIFGPMLVAGLLFGPRHIARSLGLDRGFLGGLAFALIATAPMLGYFALTSPLALPDELVWDLVSGAVLPGFGEELLFRAFLFGFLFRFAGWGFLPAALLVALTFGAAHLYQGNSAGEAAGIFAITAFGGLWFSWLYAEWGFNVWVPTFAHLLMNAYWEIFSVADSAMGPMGANIIRLVVILFSVVLTVVIAKKRRGHLLVSGRAWLWGGRKTP